MSHRLNATTLLVLVLLAACSNDDGIPRERYAAEFAAAACGAIAPCCAQDGHRYDEAGCRAAALELANVPEPGLAVEYDPDAAARCVRAYGEQLQQCPSIGLTSFTCVGAFRPTLGTGERCESYQECVGTPPYAYDPCLPTGPGELAACTAYDPPAGRSQVGDRCGSTCQIIDGQPSCYRFFAHDGACFVDDGLTCSPSSGTCTPFPVAGERCSYDVTCAAGLVCAGPIECMGGTCFGLCQEPFPLGATCEHFEGDVCVEGAVCMALDCEAGTPSCRGQCHPVGNEGERCDPYAFGSCAPGLYCPRDTRHCELPLGAGQECALRDVPCNFELFCNGVSGVCETRRGLDAPCVHSGECASFRCTADIGLEDIQQSSPVDGVCRPPATTSEQQCTGRYPNPTPTQPGTAAMR